MPHEPGPPYTEEPEYEISKTYEGWNEGRSTQAQAALLLEQCERSFLLITCSMGFALTAKVCWCLGGLRYSVAVAHSN